MLRPGSAARLARRRRPRSPGRRRLALALVAASALAPAGAGAEGLSTFRAQMWDQDLLQVPDEAETDDALGGAMASGDFDGDGYGDLAIGIPFEGVPGGGGEIDAAGAVVVLYGSATGLGLPRAQFWHQDSPGVLGLAEPWEEFGTALAAGDFNGDGYDDLAIGVPQEDSGAGSVSVLYGSASGLSATGDQVWSQNTSGVLGDGSSPNWFGKSLTAGDFDGNGYADLAIGAPLDLWGSLDCHGCGGVNVLFGSSVGLTADDDEYYRGDGFGGAYDASDNFGWALVAADFNADGFADLAIGAPQDDFLSVTLVGSVRVLFGSNAGLTTDGDLYLLGPEQDAKQGSALAAGDLDGDGLADLAIGIPGRTVGGDAGAGAVLIRLGGAGGLGDGGEWSQDSAGVQGGAEPEDRFGAALACGDFDADGRADLAIGAPDEDLSEADEGAVHVLFGAVGGVTASGDQLWYRDLLPPADPSPSNEGDHFASALVVGDFDGNGHADLAIGAPGEALTTAGNAGAVFALYDGSLFADDFELGSFSRWSSFAP